MFDLPPGMTAQQSLTVDGRRWQLETLINRQQFHDPGDHAETLGISSASWPLFGMVWPSCEHLIAHLLLDPQLVPHLAPGHTPRLLELGCGIALPSLVLHARGHAITASDWHPLSAAFLAHNAELNGLTPIPFARLDWRDPQRTGLAGIDLLLAADVLYERGHAEQLAGAIALLAAPTARVLVADPPRGQHNRFARLLEAQGFVGTSHRLTTDRAKNQRRPLIMDFARRG